MFWPFREPWTYPDFTPTYTWSLPVTCDHCRCIDLKPEGERTKPHIKCCKCGDVTLKAGA
jgi:hypothetical protein